MSKFELLSTGVLPPPKARFLTGNWMIMIPKGLAGRGDYMHWPRIDGIKLRKAPDGKIMKINGLDLEQGFLVSAPVGTDLLKKIITLDIEGPSGRRQYITRVYKTGPRNRHNDYALLRLGT